MPSWGWIAIVVIVVFLVLAVTVGGWGVGRRRTKKLKERFGPEYDRTVRQVGKKRAAERELTTRQRKRGQLDIVALSPEAGERYAANWQAVQAAFVDHPSSALTDADHLVTQVMRERGYPIDDFQRRAADISVDHPTVVENYRSAHSIYRSQQDGEVSTEDQRKAFVHYRALFEKLLEPDNGVEAEKENDKRKEARP